MRELGRQRKISLDNCYLGTLCRKGHEYENTGKSLRQNSSRHCVECNRLKGVAYYANGKSLASTLCTRARKLNVPFDLDAEWIQLNKPDVCPALGIPIISGQNAPNDNSPSIDRLIPEKGYTKDNCRIVSNRANTIKSNASPAELRSVADWLEQELKLDNMQSPVLQ